MPTLSLSDLIVPATKEEALLTLLGLLESAGFEATSWQAGSVPRTLVEGEAEAYADASELISLIARSGLVDLAEGGWLTLLGQDIYGLPRLSAVQTKGTFRLTDAGGGPHTFTAGSLIVTDANGLRFRNAAGGTLTLNGTLDVVFEAEATGAKYNLVTNASLELLTSLATVTVTNPGGVDGWITQQGADEESDANYRTRLKARWPGTTYMLSTKATYEAAARTASAEVTKVKVFPNNPSPGQVKIVLAGSAGAVSGAAITAVEAYIEDRLPLCVNATVASAEVLILLVQAQLQCEAAYVDTVKPQAEAKLAEFQASLAIGGAVYRSALIEALMAPTGMVNTVLSIPDINAILTNTQIAVFVPNLTVLAVS